MKKLICLNIMMVCLLNAYSQQVLSSAGTTFSGNSVELSWTLGETIIETYNGTSATLTQGFIQGKLSITSIESENSFLISANVFPNPAYDKLKIEFNEFKEEKYFFELTDLKGSIVYNGIITSNPQIIDMNYVKRGVFMLKVGDPLKEQWQTFKIIKQ
jgi:hypothetical protein